MASALLASREEPDWGGGRVCMRKNPNLNSNPVSNSFSRNHGRRTSELEAQAASDYSSSEMNRKLIRKSSTSTERSSVDEYITFNVSRYSRKELKNLKKRLVFELEGVRELIRRIESENFLARSEFSSSKETRAHEENGNVCQNKRKRLDDQYGSDEISSSGLMKKCGQILAKIMKDKHGWIFNSPVDVASLKLHDYYQIVKSPMDLGTVKEKLQHNIYTSPINFASDVRLTFNNAMIYNPKGHEVYQIAEQLLCKFEILFKPIYKWHNAEDKRTILTEKHCQIQTVSEVPSLPVAPPMSPPPSIPPPKSQTGRSASAKLPKPRAKDPNKRDMTYDEKQKLGVDLQNLPQAKMDQVVHIIRKRNSNLAQDGDEIEVDIESMDTETLWELDRLVYNCKKMISKMNRQVLATNQIVNKSPSKRELSESSASKKNSKKIELDDEEVDIGEEMPGTHFPPVEIEKDNGCIGLSSGSSSGSSSSESDSGSSSGSDSDADDAQSPFMKPS